MTLSRKDFLVGLGGVVVGVPLGVVGVKAQHRELVAGPALPSLTGPSTSPTPPLGNMSYAQAGEDAIVNFLFGHLKISDITYLDIGAYDPIYINNTYLFYTQGHRGVLVEPNGDICGRLRTVRPADVTLEAGIGLGKPGEADFYLMSEPSWSTFDKAEAEHQVKATDGKVTIKEIRRIPLLNVNDVIAQHFKGKAPEFVSIDAEGWHFAILKSIDFSRFRPKAICVETMVSGEYRTIPEIPAFMTTKGYVARGGSLVNTIFVDSGLLA